MENREHARAGDSEKCHRFGEAVNGISPGLAEQEQNCGNQRAGVADTYPPYEIDDGESPAHRDIHAPHPHASVEKPANGEQKPLQNQKADGHA